MNLQLSYETLLACCGSRTWAKRMVMQSAQTRDDLHAAAERIWWKLTADDWLQAFAAHPQIGQKARSSGTTDWSQQEQAGMKASSHDTAAAMAELNQRYLDKFGFIFIVCATGKSADEMRRLLEQRLSNGPAEELRIAAAEQAKITHLRLDKALGFLAV